MSKKNITSYLVVALLITSNIFLSPLKATSTINSLPAHTPGELLVKLKNSSSIYKFKFANDKELQSLLDFYNAQKEVAYAEPNYTYQASLIPNDPDFYYQSYLEKIQAPNAWNITSGTNQPIIAIIDSGVDINHPDLKNNIWLNSKETANNGIDDDANGFTDDINGWNFIDNNNQVRPQLIPNKYTEIGIKHGTVVAGIAAAEGGNNTGITGVSWHARLMILKALDNNGAGDTLTVAKAIDYARTTGANIINLSFVGEGNSQTLAEAIKKAYEANILVIAAAGNEVNDGINTNLNPRYPACHNGPNGENWVVGVGALNIQDIKANFSDYGSNCLDISAPGVGLFSTVYYDNSNDKFKKYYESGWTGTSVSAPQIAGATALIMSLRPDLPLNQIKNIILNNADNIDDLNKSYAGQLGHGRLNLIKAVSAASLATPEPIIKAHKIITSPASAGGPHVKIFQKDLLENQFFAHDEKFRGGLSLTGLINSKEEIIVSLGQGTFPWVKTFSTAGALIEKFSAYADSFRGGVEVALGDVDGDGQKEIITAPSSNGGPHIRIFTQQGLVKSNFFAFNSKERTGLNITIADMDNDGLAEIIVARKSGLAEIKIFDQFGKLKSTIYPWGNKFKAGLNLTSGDFDQDGFSEIAVSRTQGFDSEIKIFNLQGQLKSKFLAYDKNFKYGVYLAGGDIDSDGIDEIITGPGKNSLPQVRIFNINGQQKFNFLAYDKKFRGGVRVAVEK